MDLFFYIISNIVIPILVAIITVILTAYINSKIKSSKVIVIYSKNTKENVGDEKTIDVINGIYTKNIEFEKQFKDFLKDNNYGCMIYVKDLLFKTYKVYKNKEYKIYTKIIENEKNKICKMVNYFKNDYNFMFHIKRFQVFYENSLWDFKVINKGKSTIYDLKIEFEKTFKKSLNISKDLLKQNEFVNINMIYFDFAIRINAFDFGYDIPFDFGYSKHTNLSYYIVKKRKYNKKDEILFKISYLDNKAKKYEYYFCSKVLVKNNTY